MKKLIIILMGVLMAAACSRDKNTGIEGSFLNADRIGIYSGGSDVFTFVKTEHQAGITTGAGQHQFRVQDDGGNMIYYCTLDSDPTMNSRFTLAFTKVNMPGHIQSGKFLVSVVKSVDNYRWLWSADSRVGFLIMWE